MWCEGIADMPLTSSASVDMSADTTDQTLKVDPTSSIQSSLSAVAEFAGTSEASFDNVQEVLFSQASNTSHIR